MVMANILESIMLKLEFTNLIKTCIMIKKGRLIKMAKIIDKLWNWGHLEGSHNDLLGFDCSMSPEEFAKEYGIKNSFIVSYGGNIQPPFGPFAERFSELGEVVFSVLGDFSSPLPEAKLGNTQDIIEALNSAQNITGGIVDDFFSEERLIRFTPSVLMEIKEALNQKGLKFWNVLYAHQLEKDLSPYMDCFDGITFWIWRCEDIANVESYMENLKSIAGNKPVMAGVYLWDYGAEKPMDIELYKKQLDYYFDLLAKGEIEGIIFCSNTIGDAKLKTNTLLKKYIAEKGQTEI